MKKVLRYLKGTPNISLTLGGVRTTHSNSQALMIETWQRQRDAPLEVMFPFYIE
jgi:hypothetical protein